MDKKIPRKGYKVLAVIWTLAAASMAVAVARRLPALNVPLFGLFVVSLLAASSFWKTYRNTLQGDDINNDSEEKKHE